MTWPAPAGGALTAEPALRCEPTALRGQAGWVPADPISWSLGGLQGRKRSVPVHLVLCSPWIKNLRLTSRFFGRERSQLSVEQRPGPGHSFQDDAQESSPISSGPSTGRPGLDPGLPLTWEMAHHSVPL